MKDAERLHDAIISAGQYVANAITPLDKISGKDATGGSVESLTEASMGVCAALAQIASAISELADAVRDSSACSS